MSLIEDLVKGGAEGIFSGIKGIISAFKADPTVMAQNAQKLAELEVAVEQAELQAAVALSQAQNRVNEIEAASADKFAGRWRPAIGWCCGFGLAYAFIAQPVLTWTSLNFHWIAPPALNVDALMTLLFGMLGIGAQRSFDKLKGTTK
jgi:hypothetical protein